MRILVAEDDSMTRLALVKNLEKWGYETVPVSDGDRAFEMLTAEAPPRLALLDWLMPGMEGIEICRKLKDLRDEPFIYTILLTIKNEKSDIVHALDNGACDFLSKPVHTGELRSRIAVGLRLVSAKENLIEVNTELAEKNRALEKAFSEIKLLRGILPVCSQCRRIRNEDGEWDDLAAYVQKHSEAEFTHGLCPTCAKELYPGLKATQKM